ncbi:triose-phosphate isomerase [Marinimicrobium sp. C2-29]|uniref:triose-phosphate isomerase n=1 Tax=Marinimicrobium sp. C2-29 TaxID=3139825 RepID=UPI0031395DB3
MPAPLVIANWKMNGSLEKNARLLNQLLTKLDTLEYLEVGICPPFPYLPQVSDHLSQSRINLGAQNVSAFEAGAYTGEVSAAMLREFGCRYILLGHSERRLLCQESNDQVTAKFEAVLKAELTPVLCVGETLEHRQRGESESVVSTQVQTVLDRVGIQGFANAVIAYEPVWAIGTGETATPEQAQAVHAQIRRILAGHDAAIANQLHILYGGSVNAANAQTLFSQKDVDGGLVGGASLEANAFLEICKAAHPGTHFDL